MERLNIKPIERVQYSVDEAEALTGRSKWTWRRDAYLGNVASRKIGRRLYIPAEEINRVLAESTRPRKAA